MKKCGANSIVISGYFSLGSGIMIVSNTTPVSKTGLISTVKQLIDKLRSEHHFNRPLRSRREAR